MSEQKADARTRSATGTRTAMEVEESVLKLKIDLARMQAGNDEYKAYKDRTVYQMYKSADKFALFKTNVFLNARASGLDGHYNGTVERQPHVEAWRQRELAAYTKLYQAIPDDFKGMCDPHEEYNARSLWVTLEKNSLQNSETKIASLHASLGDVGLGQEMTLEKIITEMEQIRSTLRQMDYRVEGCMMKRGLDRACVRQKGLKEIISKINIASVDYEDMKEHLRIGVLRAQEEAAQVAMEAHMKQQPTAMGVANCRSTRQGDGGGRNGGAHQAGGDRDRRGRDRRGGDAGDDGDSDDDRNDRQHRGTSGGGFVCFHCDQTGHGWSQCEDLEDMILDRATRAEGRRLRRQYRDQMERRFGRDGRDNGGGGSNGGASQGGNARRNGGAARNMGAMTVMPTYVSAPGMAVAL